MRGRPRPGRARRPEIFGRLVLEIRDLCSHAAILSRTRVGDVLARSCRDWDGSIPDSPHATGGRNGGLGQCSGMTPERAPLLGPSGPIPVRGRSAARLALLYACSRGGATAVQSLGKEGRPRAAETCSCIWASPCSETCINRLNWATPSCQRFTTRGDFAMPQDRRGQLRLRTERLTLVACTPEFVDALEYGASEAGHLLGAILPPDWPGSRTGWLPAHLRDSTPRRSLDTWLRHLADRRG